MKIYREEEEKNVFSGNWSTIRIIYCRLCKRGKPGENP